MTSREDFMRSLGISSDDITDPSTVKTRHPTKVSVSSRSIEPTDDDDHHQPTPTMMSSSRGGGGGSGSFQQQQQQQSARGAGASVKRDYSTPVVVSSRNSNASPVHHVEKENAYAPRGSKATPTAAPSDNKSAREQFLRSLGIDNMDNPPQGGGAPTTATTTTTNNGPNAPARASQEYLKSKVVSAAAAAMASNDDEEEEDYTRRSSSFRPQAQPDLTLGHRRASSRNSMSNVSSSSGNYASEAGPTQGGGGGGGIATEHDNWSVEQLKTEGNKAFEEGDFRKAIRLYTKGIDREPANSALYSNRSASYLQAAKQMGIDTRAMALRDADKVIELRPDWFKGYSRRGDALFKCERYSEAAIAYERALALDSDNLNLLHSLGEARNAAGNIASTQGRTTAWSTAPTSVESLSAKKSSQELLDEMKRGMQKEAKECILVGNDFREAELQKFRELKAQQQQQTKKSAPSATSTSSSSSQPVRDPSQPQLKKEMISEEFSSDAAAAYQKSLLEQYRAKKAAQQQKDLSKYM